MYSDVINVIVDNFGFTVESKIKDGILFLRVKGIDNVSLAKYILDKTEGYQITVKEREGYKFSDIEWVKVEHSDTSQLVFVNRTNTCFF